MVMNESINRRHAGPGHRYAGTPYNPHIIYAAPAGNVDIYIYIPADFPTIET